MKHIKLFENFINENIDLTINTPKIGDIVEEYIIYNYTQKIHRNSDEDFSDGDLGERIEKYSKYELKMINILEIDLGEWQQDEDLIKEFEEKYKKTKDYPAIVLEAFNKKFKTYSIIDGSHRANALNNLGVKQIKAWVGIK